jgi:hypothetical protein
LLVVSFGDCVLGGAADFWPGLLACPFGLPTWANAAAHIAVASHNAVRHRPMRRR